MSAAHRSLAEIEGPWKEPNFESRLTERLRAAWSKPIESLTNQELVTCLGQRIAVDYLLLLAKRRIVDGFDDETEICDVELARAIEETEYWCRIDDEDLESEGFHPVKKEPNQALEPTTLLVTIPAAQEVAPSRVVAHL